MIASEAPEKIYIGIVPSDLGNYKYTTVDKDFLDATEYMRTDTFIEKAVSYIQQNWIWNTRIIEDFKKHMKGE